MKKEESKRLLCIVSSLNTGGAETFLMKIFRNLPEQYKLDFIVSASQGIYEEEVINLGGKIYRVPLRTEHPITTFYKILHVVKTNRYQFVLKLCDTPVGLYDIVAAKFGGAQQICVRSCNAGSENAKLKALVNILLRPFFNAIANVKIAPSELAANYTFGKRQVRKGNVRFIHNAIDLNMYMFSSEKRNIIRDEFCIQPQQRVIGHIGRFCKQKNHDFLIDIFAQIKQIEPNSILLLIGEGDDKHQIHEKAVQLGLEGNVIFAGVRKDIPDILSAIDILVFPSFYEGMPNVVIEAQASGLPCIISDTITKEVCITDLVSRISLNCSAYYWAIAVINSYTKERLTSPNLVLLKEKGYDIKDEIGKFISIVFEE